jgi:hypothetical protein
VHSLWDQDPIDEKGAGWARWLVDDQREASGRPDVLVFVSDVRTAPVKISGQPIANLVASTSGTDSDWVVKLIDVYPDEVAGQPEMGGYQLMISADKGDLAGHAASLPLLAAHGQPRFPTGTQDHGPGSVELVPAVRPQSADLRPQHLLGKARGLPKGGSADLPHARPVELCRAAARRHAVGRAAKPRLGLRSLATAFPSVSSEGGAKAPHSKAACGRYKSPGISVFAHVQKLLRTRQELSQHKTRGRKGHSSPAPVDCGHVQTSRGHDRAPESLDRGLVPGL